MATPTKQEMLDDVETAISYYAKRGGVQSYTIGGKTVMFGSIESLTKLRDQLKAEIARVTVSSRTHAKFVNPD
jgi:hypothetical protein